MSSDKAPEKLYYSSGVGSGTHKEPFIHDYGVTPITYIREDLINKDASYEEYLKERTAYEGQQEKEAIARAERRREMFEKVALKQLEPGHTYSSMNEYITAVIKTTNIIISESDKFARGEE